MRLRDYRLWRICARLGLVSDLKGLTEFDSRLTLCYDGSCWALSDTCSLQLRRSCRLLLAIVVCVARAVDHVHAQHGNRDLRLRGFLILMLSAQSNGAARAEEQRLYVPPVPAQSRCVPSKPFWQEPIRRACETRKPHACV